ncbi:MAG: selenide, water dikinase SelD, partial [Pyrinomonadaceae bacterium]|nr:selenide, water dikinase SelD [Pyrinomonadaceae bacterium]
GFGLLGHAFEVAKASELTLEINSKIVPLLPEVLSLISQGMLTRGDKNNRDYIGDELNFDVNVSRETQSALVDPQTAGGLLISMEIERAKGFLELYEEAVIIGEVKKRGKHLIKVY